jgi:hypothetical protein
MHGAQSRGALSHPAEDRAQQNADERDGKHRRREISPSAVVACVDAQPNSSAPRGRAGTQGSHESALHINAIVSPIPTKAYKPATVTPRQTSAMTLSGWGLICLPCTALLLGYFPTRIDHAGGGELFRFQGTKACSGEMGTSRSLARARHRAPAIGGHRLEQPLCFSRRCPLRNPLRTQSWTSRLVRKVPFSQVRRRELPVTNKKLDVAAALSS